MAAHRAAAHKLPLLPFLDEHVGPQPPLTPACHARLHACHKPAPSISLASVLCFASIQPSKSVFRHGGPTLISTMYRRLPDRLSAMRGATTHVVRLRQGRADVLRCWPRGRTSPRRRTASAW